MSTAALDDVKRTAPALGKLKKAPGFVKWVSKHAKYIGAAAKGSSILLDVALSVLKGLQAAADEIAAKYYKEATSDDDGEE